MQEFDVVIIGGGPGGYVGAVRAAQLGFKTAIIDKRETLGGTCLNVGCIPSKALLDSSEIFAQARDHFADHGVSVKDLSIDVEKMIARKDQVVADVCGGVDFLMKKNKVKRFHGFGRISGKNEVTIKNAKDDQEEAVKAKNILIATGSVPIELPNIPIDGKRIILSDHALNMKEIPKHLIVIGAGVIGLELGSVWRRLGAKVTVVEMLPRLFESADKQMASLQQRLLKAQGFEFLFEHKVLSAESKKNNVSVKIQNAKGEEKSIEGDTLLVAIGRRPFYEGLGVEEAGIELTERRRIKVDEKTFQTSVPGIYAIGDVTEGPMLAHKASDEAIAWAERLAGQAGHLNYNAIPWIVYTWPEMAWVGKGEEQLKAENVEFNSGKFLFRANARSKAMNEFDGQVKILADKKTDRLLGVHIIGPRASDMIVEAAIAFEFQASAEDLARSIHAHPTLSEIVREAAMDVGNWSIHS